MSCTSTVELQTTRSVSRDIRDETILGYRLTYECYFNSEGEAQLPVTASTKSVKEDEDHCE